MKKIILIAILLLLISEAYGIKITSSKPMAIGTITTDCKDNIKTKGFFSKIYRVINISENIKEIQLFDISPKLKTAEINCKILNYEIYDRKGKKLILKIEDNKSGFPILLLLLGILVALSLAYKKEKRTKRLNNKK